MAREIPDIEESLQLCKDMGSPSVVIPVSNIAKHFPAAAHPSYPEVPSYDLGELKKWAEEKGWSITFAKTGTMNSIKLLPGIRFSPLRGEEVSVQHATTNPSNKKPPNAAEDQNSLNIWQQPIGATWIVVVGGSLVLMVGYIFRHYLGIPL